MIKKLPLVLCSVAAIYLIYRLTKFYLLLKPPVDTDDTQEENQGIPDPNHGSAHIDMNEIDELQSLTSSSSLSSTEESMKNTIVINDIPTQHTNEVNELVAILEPLHNQEQYEEKTIQINISEKSLNEDPNHIIVSSSSANFISPDFSIHSQAESLNSEIDCEKVLTVEDHITKPISYQQLQSVKSHPNITVSQITKIDTESNTLNKVIDSLSPNSMNQTAINSPTDATPESITPSHCPSSKLISPSPTLTTYSSPTFSIKSSSIPITKKYNFSAQEYIPTPEVLQHLKQDTKLNQKQSKQGKKEKSERRNRKIVSPPPHTLGDFFDVSVITKNTSCADLKESKTANSTTLCIFTNCHNAKCPYIHPIENQGKVESALIYKDYKNEIIMGRIEG